MHDSTCLDRKFKYASAEALIYVRLVVLVYTIFELLIALNLLRTMSLKKFCCCLHLALCFHSLAVANDTGAKPGLYPFQGRLVKIPKARTANWCMHHLLELDDPWQRGIQNTKWYLQATPDGPARNGITPYKSL